MFGNGMLSRIKRLAAQVSICRGSFHRSERLLSLTGKREPATARRTAMFSQTFRGRRSQNGATSKHFDNCRYKRVQRGGREPQPAVVIDQSVAHVACVDEVG